MTVSLLYLSTIDFQTLTLPASNAACIGNIPDNLDILSEIMEHKLPETEVE